MLTADEVHVVSGGLGFRDTNCDYLDECLLLSLRALNLDSCSAQSSLIDWCLIYGCEKRVIANYPGYLH